MEFEGDVIIADGDPLEGIGSDDVACACGVHDAGECVGDGLFGEIHSWGLAFLQGLCLRRTVGCVWSIRVQMEAGLMTGEPGAMSGCMNR